MTSGRVFLAAKQGDPTGLDLLLQPIYTIEERLGSLHHRVVYPAFRVVELLSFGPSSQLQAKEQVLDTATRQDSFDIFGVEVRRVPGVRVGTSICQNLDSVCLQQAD